MPGEDAMLRLVEEIIGVDPHMRFAAVIDGEGNILEAIMKEGKTNLKSQQEEAHFCRQVAQRRAMRDEFNSSLGMVRYVQVERERLTQVVVYPAAHTIYFTLEPEVPCDRRLQIISRIKALTSRL